MKHTTTRQSLATTLALFLLLLAAATQSAFAQSSTAFSYQGRLQDGGAAANGTYDLQFALFDAASAGTQQGANVTLSSVQVTGGVFTVQLDFGVTAFPGAARFLQISVRAGGSTGAYTLLTPRQALSATPYALRSASAAAADNAMQLGGVAASQYVQTADPRLSDARTPTPFNNNYIQNQNGARQVANFDISGNGVVGASLSVGGIINADGGIAAGGSVTAGSFGTSGLITANGGITVRDNIVLNGAELRLRDANDLNHSIVYNPNVDGPQFTGYTGFIWVRGNGNVAQMTLNSNGVLWTRSGFNGRCVGIFAGDGKCNQDLAETFRTKEQTEPGDVVTLIPQDHARPTVRRSLRAYDEHLVGVVSTNPGLVFDEGETKLAGENDKYITKEKTVVAAVGRVPVKFSLENGAINVGDPLTSSATEPGKAMKATGAGKIIGIALESSA